MPITPPDPRDAAPADAATVERPSALLPLKTPIFRMLWGASVVANTCMWMNDVAAAWMMTSLTTSPVMVALVQSASTLPMFLLGLPSGALADTLDRRRYFMLTQIWVAGVAMLLCAFILGGWITAPLLLALTFLNGIGLAMRWPVYSAILPELVPRTQLAQATALNSVAANASRIIGPLAAGAIIASAGSAWVFVLNAVLSIGSAFVITRWKRIHVPSPLGRERLASAVRVGVQFVAQSPRLRSVLLRIACFFIHSTALIAMLPLIARALPGGDARTFTVLLASMGAGAIFGALVLQPRLRLRVARDNVVGVGTVVVSAATAIVSYAPHLYMAVPAMAIGGAAWICTANSLTTSAQFALPDWVRARGMAIVQMALMGATATGAAVWGQVASLTNLHTALGISALSGVLVMLAVRYFMPDRSLIEDLTPSNAMTAPKVDLRHESGRVQMTVEYRIDPARAAEFRVLMQESRRSRLRQGALEWQLQRDAYDPALYYEQIVDESWTEHLRRFDRVTASDVALRDRKLAFHVGENRPAVSRRIIER
jgi:MFS family permease